MSGKWLAEVSCSEDRRVLTIHWSHSLSFRAFVQATPLKDIPSQKLSPCFTVCCLFHPDPFDSCSIYFYFPIKGATSRRQSRAFASLRCKAPSVLYTSSPFSLREMVCILMVGTLQFSWTRFREVPAQQHSWRKPLLFALAAVQSLETAFFAGMLCTAENIFHSQTPSDLEIL